MPDVARRLPRSVKQVPAETGTPPVGLRPADARVNGAVGLREQKKLDKRQRIRSAARELFSKLGYEAATLRQIARRAHVGLGTLFNYADDKRDLIFLIMNEELDAIAERASNAAEAERGLLGRLTAFFRVYYRELGRELTLSRILLQELTFYSHGKQAAEFQNHRHRLVGRLELLVQQAQVAGEIRKDQDAAVIAQYVFFMYSTAIRWWIGRDNPEPEQGVAELRRLLQMQIQGLLPQR